MGARSSTARGDGLSFPQSYVPGSTSLIAAASDMRLRTVYVVVGAVATTVDVQVNGVSILARSDHPSGVLAIGARQAFKFTGEFIAAGTDYQFTTTDPTARFSAEFVRV